MVGEVGGAAHIGLCYRTTVVESMGRERNRAEGTFSENRSEFKSEMPIVRV
jgi:hypothetical protein